MSRGDEEIVTVQAWGDAQCSCLGLWILGARTWPQSRTWQGRPSQLREAMGPWRHASVGVSTSAAPVTKCGHCRNQENAPALLAHRIFLASPGRKGHGPWGAGEGFKAVAHVSRSFLLPTTSLGSYIAAPFWSPRPGDTQAGPSCHMEGPGIAAVLRGVGRAPSLSTGLARPRSPGWGRGEARLCFLLFASG